LQIKILLTAEQLVILLSGYRPAYALQPTHIQKVALCVAITLALDLYMIAQMMFFTHRSRGQVGH
jgi:hypothetical protein